MTFSYSVVPQDCDSEAQSWLIELVIIIIVVDVISSHSSKW